MLSKESLAVSVPVVDYYLPVSVVYDVEQTHSAVLCVVIVVMVHTCRLHEYS